MQKVLESDSFASLRWKMIALKPENDQIWHKLVGHSTKLVGANLKVGGAVAPQLYRKLRPWTTNKQMSHHNVLKECPVWLGPLQFSVLLCRRTISRPEKENNSSITVVL